METAVTETAFIDVDHAQRCKNRQSICGDVFLSHRIKEEGRILAVLSDGLGSGVKASVLANLTASMALKFASTCTDTRIWARSIMDTLPICEVRKISYSTFTLIDLDESGSLRFIEHGNPPLVLLRGAEEVELERSVITLERWKERLIYHGRLQAGNRRPAALFFRRRHPVGHGAKEHAPGLDPGKGGRLRPGADPRQARHLLPATDGGADGSGAGQRQRLRPGRHQLRGHPFPGAKAAVDHDRATLCPPARF